MRSVRAGVAALVAWTAVVACEHEFEPPDRQERVRSAEAEYTPALFDSITWASREARVQEGNAIYAQDCRRCHGVLGRGVTDYAAERNLEVPSLVEPEWSLDDLDDLRHEIYIGHETGMPIFGQGGLSLYDCARWAVAVHGAAADLWSERHGDAGLLATDLLEYIPDALHAARKAVGS